MGYEDDFYRLRNLAGYTGDLAQQRGSLYFESPRESKYGRITVGHQLANNNGRGRVEIFPSFVRRNMYYDPTDPGTGDSWDPWLSDVPTASHTELRHVEKSRGAVVHVSRDQYTQYPQAIPKATLAMVIYIIDNYPNQKANGQY